MSTVDTIKDRLSITDVVGAYVKLEKAGANLKGICPFHQEKTPSFMVSPARSSYYCFGCGAKGDIFSFVEQFEGLDFMGALKVLADRAGVEIKKEDPSAKTERERLFRIMETASLFYHKGLSEDQTAKDYLKKRGVEVQTIRAWRLGYALAEWRSLYAYLISKGFSAQEMLKAGLVKSADNGFYDTFRSRIIFPIANTGGRIVAFSGRIFPVDDEAAKYLNSPETALFNKSAVMHGYDKAKFEIRTKNLAILVEGQMDLILSHQVGITNTIATSGTAFTDLHAGLIKRFAEKLVICYDGDKAGVAAALRAAVVALRSGLDVRIARLPDEKDPADMCIENKQAYLDAIAGAEHVIDFALGTILRAKLDKRQQEKLIVSTVLPYVKALESPVEQGHFLLRIADRSKIREDDLRAELKHLPIGGSAGTSNSSPLNSAGSAGKSTVMSASLERPIRESVVVRQLFGIMLLLDNSPAVKTAGDTAGDKNPASPKEPPVTADFIQKEIARIEGDDRAKALVERFKDQKEEMLFEAERAYSSTDFIEADVKELLKRLEIEQLEQRYAEAADALAIAEREKDEGKTAELLEACRQISKKLSILK
ncbi:TPA: DNA primase [Candidatus Taylorbacteria bacterium]|nr:DNA primase [Candidatus Taylorbacteria bacterium]